MSRITYDNVFNQRRVFAYLIVAGMAIILLGLSRWDYMQEGEFLGKWASVITVMSVAISPLWYFFTKGQDARDEQNRASENLYGELKDALNALNSTKYPLEAVTVNMNDKEYFFMNRDLNHDIYDSLVFSGRINFLTHDIQQGVQDVFKRIKQHNDYTKHVMQPKGNKELDPKHRPYVEWLSDTESRLLKDIPNTMKALEKGFRKRSIL